MQNIHASLNNSDIKITVSNKISSQYRGNVYRTINMGERLSMTLNDTQQETLFNELERHLFIRTRKDLQKYITNLEEQINNNRRFHMEVFSKVELIKIREIITGRQTELNNIYGHYFDEEIEENNGLLEKVDKVLEQLNNNVT
ncbi:hypothetical protein [Clostridium sp.]|uniref:hypothetical protein n=1 Tax=Clostridium sp. TaxID=1506 RepID=UPI001A4951F4|nr:hypothetical protein [Clostridium sp.]MBK5239864.1 hypothetical protein [Clostridium sp.]